ncbi:MAG: hypothetical protein R6V03_07345 [Kiritimatiellia bacterium]
MKQGNAYQGGDRKASAENRPVIYAENHLSRARKEKTTGIPDVWGANYEIDILDALEEASPSRCVIVSEYANSPHARSCHGVPGNPPREGSRSRKQSKGRWKCTGKSLRVMRLRPLRDRTLHVIRTAVRIKGDISEG